MWYWKLLDRVTRCLGLSWIEDKGRSGRQVAKSYLPMSIVMRERDGADFSRVQFILGW
jgi:hypothetical protein